MRRDGIDHWPLKTLALLLLSLWVVHVALAEPAVTDPLPAWRDGPSKTAIVDFVARVTTPGGQDFIPVPERIAVFDHDGTLWTEQPIYPQFAFVIDRVRALAPRFPGWKEKQPFKAALEGDLPGLAEHGPGALLQLMIATQSGMSTDQFDVSVRDWLARTTHPRFGRRYTELTYQPMLELLAYLQGNGFKNWIVSGGGSDFIRVWSEQIYGIPPERVIGSSIQFKFEMAEGRPLLIRMPEIDFINNEGAKPVGIYRHIGRRPVAAFGNSDGDLPMLQWTVGGAGPKLAALIHHTDAVREYAYDRTSKVGHLDKALDEARRRHWLIVSTRHDWTRMFPTDR